MTSGIQIQKNGHFYSTLAAYLDYNAAMKHCIYETVENLVAKSTTVEKPGMLLGNIQSGKTRTFIGVIGMAFDNEYDMAIVLTKGTKALAKQTYERLHSEFASFAEDDQLQVFDIMQMPDYLSSYERNQKLIFVVKKQKQNLARLHELLFDTYPELARKRILMIDDEADYASIGFEKTKKEATDIRTIAGQIDGLRHQLVYCSFLQVTATPYSLYLQPETIQVHEHKTFQPIRPAFTSLVPIPNTYIGGKFYFEESEERGSLASYLHEEIANHELVVLKKEDRRRFKIEHVLKSDKITTLRNSVVQFLIGGYMRRIQQQEKNERLSKYAFIIHTEINKVAHGWQEQVIVAMITALERAAVHEQPFLTTMLQDAYSSLVESMKQFFSLEEIPSFQQVQYEVTRALVEGHILVSKVNSEKQVEQLLDDKGELKLRTPLTIFIGGQILDRGITVRNLIGFYYGRNPRTFQQDTVLQHSRMYGYRSFADLTVTRFYTTQSIFQVMKQIHEFDTALRDAFELGGHNAGVVFIRKDEQDRIIPCSPNKLLLSKTTTLKPYKRLLPIGFQTGYQTYIKKSVGEIDRKLRKVKDGKPTLVKVKAVSAILRTIAKTIEMEDGYHWDVEAMIAAIEYLSNQSDDERLKGKVWLITRFDRNIARFDQNGRFISAPDTPGTGGGEAAIAKQVAKTIPAIILLRQKGEKEKGWRDAPFWWPIAITPQKTEATIFANELPKEF
ncbi:hypothetical protein N784_15235 [Pontibacillus litoralis JSM 072002]|uniref:Putative endonuclease Z1 domain-containing protein n=1 Tax=Pontibacillus litoralis JSM 072002 TaxID=1385512 RepID=A0A0A5G6E4_9BACI|nr:Z1 domain-containing protein [Pontibacillus litoralis]KGX87599.1 hypothetical protein N784_15235 [Pontibacillus litoralis JSM 072002]